MILTPDIVHRPSAELEAELADRGHMRRVNKAIRALPTEAEITELELRIQEVQIGDFREGWFDAEAEVYLIATVADGLSEQPAQVHVSPFTQIQRKDRLELGKEGLAVYRNPEGKLPRFLDYRILVMESDETIRDAGTVLEEIASSDTYKDITANLTALAAAANPYAVIAAPAVDLIVDLIARILKLNKDDQLIQIAGSFNRKLDQYGLRHGQITHRNRFCAVKYAVVAA